MTTVSVMGCGGTVEGGAVAGVVGGGAAVGRGVVGACAAVVAVEGCGRADVVVARTVVVVAAIVIVVEVVVVVLDDVDTAVVGTALVGTAVESLTRATAEALQPARAARASETIGRFRTPPCCSISSVSWPVVNALS